MAQTATSARAAIRRPRALVNSAKNPGELQSERHGLRMDPVRAADRGGELVFERPPFEGCEQGVEVGDQEIGRTRELDAQARVEHVRRRHALVDEARVRPDDLGQMREERDDVVLRLPFDLVDACDVEIGIAAALPDRAGRLARHDPEFGERAGGMRLDLEPDPETRLRRPEGGHLGTAVAGDHGSLPAITPIARAPPRRRAGSR